jgi:hypothetical protein
MQISRRIDNNRQLKIILKLTRHIGIQIQLTCISIHINQFLIPHLLQAHFILSQSSRFITTNHICSPHSLAGAHLPDQVLII